MEFKSFIAIFYKQRKSFWVTVLVCVCLGALWQYAQKESVSSNLTLNITRAGSEQTTDYQYHDFYRLQADERFADTVVRWLGSPRMVSDIYANAQLSPYGFGIQSLSHVLKAERLSSQMIQVTYRAKNESDAKNIAVSLIERVNKEADMLNQDQKESAWFIVIGDNPVVSEGRISMLFTLFISLALGILIGFWVVLWRQYFVKQ